MNQTPGAKISRGSKPSAQAKKFALLGGLLGLCSPLGLMAVRYFMENWPWISEWVTMEWHYFIWVYVYSGLATAAVFWLFGTWVGRRNDLLAAKAALLEQLSDKLKEASITDSLTGLFVHGYALDRLAEELRRAARYSYPLGGIFLDIDYFKTLNDRHGHTFGDKVLMAVSRIVREQVRATDIVGRYGGDEILIILPQTDSLSAYQIAERIRKKTKELVLRSDSEDVRITLSLGVYAAVHWPHTNQQFIEMVDRALHQAKITGKDRSVMHTTKIRRFGRIFHHEAEKTRAAEPGAPALEAGGPGA